MQRIRKYIKTVGWLGALVFIAPFLGVPRAWRTWIIAIIGVVIVILSLRVYSLIAKGADKPYMENGEDHRNDNTIEEML